MLIGSCLAARIPLAILERQLADRRSRRVVFVSHCLLNENVRYLGGACRAGPVDELVDQLRRMGVGICQMPCPEQRAWGGVLKRRIARAYGSDRTKLWRFRGILLRLFSAYTRMRYAMLARDIASQIRDYMCSGFAVEGIVGVAASPSCGVHTTLDVQSWLDTVGGYRSEDIDPRRLNGDAIIPNAVPGAGWFISALRRRLRHNSATVPMFEYDLLKELMDQPTAPLGTPPHPESRIGVDCRGPGLS
jgi:predicted secreted protein